MCGVGRDEGGNELGWVRRDEGGSECVGWEGVRVVVREVGG